MFVSAHYSYLVCGSSGLEQRFLCAFYESETPPPATAQDLELAGYQIDHRARGGLSFFKDKVGFLSSQPNLVLSHGEGVDRCETFREIDPAILPLPLTQVTEEKHIAKNIHQVGIFKDNPGSYPDVYADNRSRVVSMNQSYNYYFWSEGGYYDVRDFIKEHYGKDVLKYYDAINIDYPAARADLFRYLCLYAVGGVYFDLKTSFAYPFDKIIRPSDRFILSHWYHGAHGHFETEHIPYGEYEQYYLICAAGHPLMRCIIQQMLCNITVYDAHFNGVGFYGTVRFLGPLMFSMIVHEYMFRYSEGVRRIHSFSNGIEFTIFRDDAAHRRKGGVTHYSDQDQPLVDPQRREELLFNKRG